MKIIAWMVVNNEIDFLPITFRYSDFYDKIFILDTGSNDGSYEFLQEAASKDSRITVEKYHTSFTPNYSKAWEEMENPFPEVEVRNHALNRVEQLYKSGWLVQLDGDEIFLPTVRNVLQSLPSNIFSIGHSTINPVAKLEDHPIENRFGMTFYDPHARIWKLGLGAKYWKNPKINGEFHSIPGLSGKHLFEHRINKFVPEVFHFHLHWIYGKKMEGFYHQKGIMDRKEMVADQVKNEYAGLVPVEFWERRDQWINEG